MTRPLSRFEGRLFTEGGCLYMVVKVDEAAGTARVSGRIGGRVQVVERPLHDVTRRVAASTGVILDNLNAPDNEERLTHASDGWYFTAREGRIGPFPSREEAARRLAGYVLSMQTAPGAPRGPALPARGRRRQAA
ncbi:MAG TPA: DUF6316 family protein [Pseudomonadales bacterium]